MSEVTIKIRDDGYIAVEKDEHGIKSYKPIAADSLIECVNKSLLRGGVSSGLLPKGCISFTSSDNGDMDICILHPEIKADISYYGSSYVDFPLPKLVFGFCVGKENRISNCRLGVVANDDILKPTTVMYYYPFSNVNGFHLCTGNNSLPKCQSLYTLGSLPYFILSMPNNNDYFKSCNNKQNMEMRDLFELLKDKNQAYYYKEILIPNGATLNNFIKGEDIFGR